MPAFHKDTVESLRRLLESKLPPGLTATFGHPWNYGRTIGLAVHHGDNVMGEYTFGWLGRASDHIGYHGPILSEYAMEGVAMIFTGWQPPTDKPEET